MTILRTTRSHNDKTIEIFVKYDEKENTVEEIKSVNLRSGKQVIPIGGFVHAIDELLTAVNAIIDNTDWREIYRSTNSEQEIDNYLDSVPVPTNLHPVMQQAISPFIQIP